MLSGRKKTPDGTFDAPRSHTDVQSFEIPESQHRTLAGPAQGLRSLEVWDQVVAPGGATPTHRHDCEEVIVVLQGKGRCEFEGSGCDFQAPATLIIPAGVVHQITNTGETDMRVVAALSMAPVVVQAPGGETIRLPWG